MNNIEEILKVGDLTKAMDAHIELLRKKAELEVEKLKAEVALERLVAAAVRDDGFVLGKNEDERKANKRARFPEICGALDDAEVELKDLDRQITIARDQRDYYRLIIDYFGVGG